MANASTKYRIAINGYGRIGQCVLRALVERQHPELEVVAINELSDLATITYLTRYDTTHGRFPGEVDNDGSALLVNGQRIHVLCERDPQALPWGELDIDLVLECSGSFKDRATAEQHLTAGAKRLLFSQPAENDVDATIVWGINEHELAPTQRILSAASCTTNCVATMTKVIHDSFGVERGLMTTIHSYTNDQNILDQIHTDLRRARAAAMNIIPTTTGAAKAVGVVLPELNGKIHGMAFRVPTPTGSVTDFVANIRKSASADDINDAYREAAAGSMAGILDYTDEPLVSSDFIRNPHSCIIDGLSTISLGGNMVKVVGWYDNEWGYSCRVADLAHFLTLKGL